MLTPVDNSDQSKLSNFSEIGDEGEHTDLPIRKYADVFSYIYANEPHNFKRYLGTLRYDEIKEAVNERNDAGKSPLDIAASLGRVTITKMLVASGAKIDSYNSKGYSCVHYAAAWGHLPVLKVLVGLDGNFNKRTVHGESPADLAARYNMVNCAEYLDLTVAVKRLQVVINQTQDKFKDDKGFSSRFNKEDKMLLSNACAEKSEWLANATDLTAREVKNQIAQIEMYVQAVLCNKVNDSFLRAQQEEDTHIRDRDGLTPGDCHEVKGRSTRRKRSLFCLII